MAHHVEKHEKTDPENASIKDIDESVSDKQGVKTIVETKAAKEAREKAEWDRLTFVEKLVKKYFPSQINSIAIFVIDSTTIFLSSE